MVGAGNGDRGIGPDDGRLMRAAEVPGDMHWIREIARAGTGDIGVDGLRMVTAEDRGKSGYNRGTAVRIAWCGVSSEAGRVGGRGVRGVGSGVMKMTHNMGIVTCQNCIEAEGLYRAAEGGRRTPTEEFTDAEWVGVLNKFGPKTHIWVAQRWVWEQRMAAME